MMGKKKGTLIYHWDGHDALVDGKWVDRVQGFVFGTKHSGYIPQQSNDGAYVIESYNFFYSSLILTPGLNIGRLWRIEVDFSVLNFRPGNKSIVLFDFGSIGNASHGFCLVYENGGYYSSNYKGLSNSDDANYGPHLYSDLVEGVRHIVATGCKAYGSENDIQWLSIDGANPTYADYPHPQTYFNKNFNGSDGAFGAGFRYDSVGYSLKLYSIKIFNYD